MSNIMASLSIKCIKNCVKQITIQKNVRFIYVNYGETINTDKKENILLKKFNEINEWYVKLTGLDEVKRLQDKVIFTQEKLEKVQEERREIGKLVTDVRKRSNEIQEQLHQVKRWENVERFLELTKLETEMMKEEKHLTSKFDVLDKAERELFTTLSNTVRDSHEKEKAQAEYTKYWGIILSIIGTIVGAVVSTIISTIRNKQIVTGINQGVEEKFLKITNMFNDDKINNVNFDSIVDQIQKNISEQILKELQENNKLINATLESNRQRYLLSVEGDKYLEMTNFVEAQTNLLTDHQNQIKIIKLVLACLGVVTLALLGTR